MKLETRDARFWLIGGAAVALVMLVAGWLLIISPQRNSTASLRIQAADAEAANAAVAAKVAGLARLNRDRGHLTFELGRVLAALPSDSGLPAFTRQVTAQAAAHDITVHSISVGGLTMPVGDPAAGTDTSTATVPDGTDPAAASTPATTDAGVPAGVVSIPITLISDGAAADQLAFLRAIRVTGPRRALVTSTGLSVPATAGATSIRSSCTMTVSLTVFSAVRTAAEQAEYAKLLRG